MSRAEPAGRVRELIRVRGEVQGVGYRPFVFRQAERYQLAGWVRNDGHGVVLEVEGEADVVAKFAGELTSSAPELARVHGVDRAEIAVTGANGFAILASQGGGVRTGITPDAATCAACRAELFDRSDRRYRYAFANCTLCGPRYTITRALPYDRAQTSMAGFTMCARCQAEYDDPRDRRFHAQPNACPECGPQLALVDPSGAPLAAADVVAAVVARIRAGEILAIKGLGGFHLVCDARSPAAVATLRRRKQREEKPLAVMVANSASLAALAAVGDGEAALLRAVERPIVLLRKRAACDVELEGVAGGVAWLGAMLPYTPLHYLLFHAAAGHRAGAAWLDEVQALILVMTSANPGGEPLVIGNDEAVRRLGGIADAIVISDREIVARCDDSVMRVERKPRFIRRARGYTPRALRLPGTGPATLAFGAELKNTVCVTRGDEAFVSTHIGDLDNAATRRSLSATVDHMLDVLAIEPEVVACDLHPDFFSTRCAADFATAHELPLVAVQHHHAHVAAVVAEHQLAGPVIGVALDGFGFGSDGGAWGGELLRVDSSGMRRLGHLRHLPLPGGDRAAREPWRLALAALHLLGRSQEAGARWSRPEVGAVVEMLARDVRCPPTSSAGRWFDGAAGVLGVCEVMAFEGQAAMLLEGLAEAHGRAEPFADGFAITTNGALDLLPTLAELAAVDRNDSAAVAHAAARFHATFALGLSEWVGMVAGAEGLAQVVLSGGCFLNHILSRELRAHLEGRGLSVFGAELLPCNDGASNGHDELVELVSRADEPVHLVGASLWWKGERRGGFLFSPCIQPRTAAVVSTTGAGNLKLPMGALEVQLDRTLRLSDGGGSLEIRGIKGTSLDAVDVPAAVTPDAPAVWSRARDGDWHASLRSHNEVAGATRPASLGRCANAARFPCCLGWLDAYIEKGRYSE